MRTFADGEAASVEDGAAEDTAVGAAAAAEGAVQQPPQRAPHAVAMAGQPTRRGTAADATAALGANGLQNGASSVGGSSSDEDSPGPLEGGPAVADAAMTANGGEALPPGAAAPTEAAAAQQGQDVYDEAETDPAKCRALESSLWEVAALRSHYDPQVSKVCDFKPLP